MINISINTDKKTFEIEGYGQFLFNELTFFYAGDSVFARNRYTNASILPGINYNQFQNNDQGFESITAFDLFVKNNLYGTEARWKIISDFTIGDNAEGSPIDGAESYQNPNLAGHNHSTTKIDLNGSYLAVSDYSFASEGGINLEGHTFSTGDRYIIWIFN